VCDYYDLDSKHTHTELREKSPEDNDLVEHRR